MTASTPKINHLQGSRKVQGSEKTNNLELELLGAYEQAGRPLSPKGHCQLGMHRFRFRAPASHHSKCAGGWNAHANYRGGYNVHASTAVPFCAIISTARGGCSPLQQGAGNQSFFRGAG
eukprot:1157043-Pelagomonas_calceolata.AAC.5